MRKNKKKHTCAPMPRSLVPKLEHVVKSFLLHFTVERGSHVSLCEENLQTEAPEDSVEHWQHEQQLLHKPACVERMLVHTSMRLGTMPIVMLSLDKK